MYQIIVKGGQEGKKTQINFSDKQVANYDKYLNRIDNSGGIYDAIPQSLSAICDYLSVDDYGACGNAGACSPLSYSTMHNIAVSRGKIFLQFLETQKNASQPQLNRQRIAADKFNVPIYALWSMTGIDNGSPVAIETACAVLPSGYIKFSGNKQYDSIICYDYGEPVYTVCSDLAFISDVGRGNTEIPTFYDDCDHSILNYIFAIKSIEASNSVVWNWWKNL